MEAWTGLLNILILLAAALALGTLAEGLKQSSIVGYLIADLAARGQADVGGFLRGVEQALVSALAELDLPGHTLPGYTGVFAAPDALTAAQAGTQAGRRPARSEQEANVGGLPPGVPRKLASIGVGIRRWVTYHGFALNVNVDLRGFAPIVPCGLHHVEMTSVARELERRGPPAAAAALDARARAALARAFQRWLD